MNNNGYKLNIESDAFKSMRVDFDKVLKKTLYNMTAKESNSAELTIKVKVDLLPTKTVGYTDGKESINEYLKPTFTHKINSVMTTKLEESGIFNGEYALVWDEDLQDYVAKPVGVQQTTIFNDEEEYEDKTGTNEPLMLTEGEKELGEINSDFDDIDVVDRLKDMYLSDDDTPEEPEE